MVTNQIYGERLTDLCTIMDAVLLIDHIIHETIDDALELGNGFWPHWLNMVQFNVAAHLCRRKASKIYNLAEGGPESLLIERMRRIPGWHFTETAKSFVHSHTLIVANAEHSTNEERTEEAA